MTQQVFACAKCGQESSESDFCSECGARIDPASGSGSVAGTASPTGQGTIVTASGLLGLGECPECHTPRPSPEARFCEVCRYDFVKQAAGGPPVVATAAPLAGPPEAQSIAATPLSGESQSATPSAPPPTSAGATPQPSTAGVPAPAPNGVMWDVVITVDPSLDTDPDPDLKAPEDPERRIPLDKAENLIGRRDVTQPSPPDVRPHDPSVSRRHAKLLVHADGTIAILDLESANGTFVNGAQILAGVAQPLVPSDVVTMGRWTRLRIEPRGDP